MNLNARITMAIRNFFKKYGRIIVIAFVIWLIIFVINQYLKNRPRESQLINTYSPDNPVIDDGGSVPTAYRKTVKDTIDNFFKYCNSKNYEQAYNLLTEDCKEYLYGDLELFKEYVDNIFTTAKIYNLQNYSNVDDIYIYDIVITDDIEVTGTTGGYEPYKEKIAVRKENNSFKISNQGFIRTQEYNKVAEDDYLRVTVNSKDMSYRKEGYNVTITNKSDKYIVLVDNSVNTEVTLNLGDQKRKVSNYSNATIIINPNSTEDVVLIFDKFYDDGKEPTELSLESVRVLENYEIDMENTSGLAERMYSFNVKLK